MLSGLAESPYTLEGLRPSRMPGCVPCWMQNHGVGAKIAFCRPDSGLGHLLLPNDALVQVDGVDVRLTNTVEVHPLCPTPTHHTPPPPRARSPQLTSTRKQGMFEHKHTHTTHAFAGICVSPYLVILANS